MVSQSRHRLRQRPPGKLLPEPVRQDPIPRRARIPTATTNVHSIATMTAPTTAVPSPAPRRNASFTSPIPIPPLVTTELNGTITMQNAKPMDLEAVGLEPRGVDQQGTLVQMVVPLT